MAVQIGERFELSEGAVIVLYYDGAATLIKGGNALILDTAEVAALRHAFAAQDAAESEKL